MYIVGLPFRLLVVQMQERLVSGPYIPVKSLQITGVLYILDILNSSSFDIYIYEMFDTKAFNQK